VGEGTGLGLAITHQIIQQHGGDIRVESRVGEGTSFHITLPTASSVAVHQPAVLEAVA
jgi:two-component system NtrC family sensor kinase